MPSGCRRRRRRLTRGRGRPAPFFAPTLNETEKQEVLQEFVGHEGRITRAVWGALNRTIISAGEDGTVRLWDVEVRARARRGRERLRC